ncbi:MAG: O-antigen ligase family protein [Verrucomicrobiota bacterium]
MDFFGISFYMVLQYLRVHEWNSLFGAMHLVSLAALAAVVGIVFRKDGFSLKRVFCTPHDYALVVYLGWILYTAEYWRDAWGLLQAYFLMYLIFVQALSNLDRIRRLLALWTVLIYILAALAVASEFGFDPFDTYDRTHGMWKGRLALHLSGVHNPNSLGHTVVPILAAIYFYWVWKRPIFVKEVAIPLMAVPFACVFMTQSKGAFLVGFITLLTAFVFGRPRVVQILILVLALTSGVTALNKLPRMEQMRSPRADPGIVGRLDAFKFGLIKMQENPRGLGVQGFVREFERATGLPFSPHSTYVGLGADLGYLGLVLYLAIAYCCARTLVTAKNLDVDEERVRRILVTFLVAQIVSGWLINWSYHMPFFILAATTAAFHRHLQLKAQASREEVIVAQPALAPVSALAVPHEVAPAAAVLQATQISATLTKEQAPATSATESAGVTKLTWKRIGIIDLLIIWVWGKATLEFWMYVIKNF